MKTTFQKTLIAAATGVALLSAVGTANANSLLFPYFTTATGAQSVVSLSNAGAAPADQNVHYVYNYGAKCVHFDAVGKLTANDILSHSVAQPAGVDTLGAASAGTPGAGGFGKVVGTDTSTPVYFPLADQTGFLVVSSRSTAALDALRGSMAIVDPASGLVVSYAGIDNNLATNAGNEGNFAAITDLNFPLTSLPADMVTTSWYAVVVGDMNAAIGAGANWGPGVTFTNTGTGVWNNDEALISGTTSKSITCSGTLLASDLMTTAQAAAVGTNGSLVKAGGVAVAAAAPAVGTATGVVLMKMQKVMPAAGAPFAGKQFLHREQAGL